LVISIEPATLQHAQRIELRDGDRREIAALGLAPDEALARSLARSLWADAYLADGEVAALIGVALQPLVGGVAMPWLMTGRAVDRHRKSFMAITRTRTQQMLAEHGTLVCQVHAEYAGAVRWLRWLGFALAPARPLGPRGALFHQATLTARRMKIGKSSIAALEAAPNMPDLLAEYASEAAIDGLPPPYPKWEAYRTLETAGLLHVLSATVGDELAGFITVLAAPLPRYSAPVATSESFFVARAHRKTGAGLKLLRAAEDKARDLGSSGLLVSAPSGGTLAQVLPRVGYAETNRVFFKQVRRG
jgi:GNAT superfamily N-acetyltransferase